MIPVLLQPKPVKFDELVANPGKDWLTKNAVHEGDPLPQGLKLPNFWVNVLPQLWSAYGGVCAYYGYFFELASGAQSTDHFAPKSMHPAKAFDWENMRLACLEANRRKHKHEDVIDPMELERETFHLNLYDGRIYPNPTKSAEIQSKAQNTLDRLDLDDLIMRELRARHFSWYQTGEVSKSWLEKRSPFVFQEAQRQNLL